MSEYCLFISKYFFRENAKSEISKLKTTLEESQSEKNALMEELRNAKELLTSNVKVSAYCILLTWENFSSPQFLFFGSLIKTLNLVYNLPEKFLEINQI